MGVLRLGSTWREVREEQPVAGHGVIHPRERHEDRRQAAGHRDDHADRERHLAGPAEERAAGQGRERRLALVRGDLARPDQVEERHADRDVQRRDDRQARAAGPAGSCGPGRGPRPPAC